MTPLSYVLGVVLALFTLLFVLEKLRRRRLRERHATWWVIAGLGATIMALFPGILEGLSRAIGIELPVNLLFFLSLLVLFLVCIQQSTELTDVEAKTRRLAEEVALLNIEVERLRGDAPSSAPQGDEVNRQSDDGPADQRANGTGFERGPG